MKKKKQQLHIFAAVNVVGYANSFSYHEGSE